MDRFSEMDPPRRNVVSQIDKLHTTGSVKDGSGRPHVLTEEKPPIIEDIIHVTFI